MVCTTCGSAIQPGASCEVDGQVAPLAPPAAATTETEHLLEQRATSAGESEYRSTSPDDDTKEIRPKYRAKK